MLYIGGFMEQYTQNQENEWLYQPVEVKKIEKVVTKTEVTWEPIGD